MKKFLVLVCIISLFLAGVPFAYSGTITETGMSQKDLVRFLSNVVTIVNELKADVNLLRYQNLTGTVSSAGLTSNYGKTTDVATAYMSSPIKYIINGNFYDAAASANLYIPTTAAQSTPTYCYYLFSINSSGVISVTKGTEGSATASLTLPGIPADTAPFGAVLVYAAQTSFTMGTSTFEFAVLGNASPTWYNLSTVNSGASAASSISATDLSLVNP
jgi:hypothetical protein